MPASTPLFAGGAGLFLAFTVSQYFIADRTIRRIYLHYAAYLFCILLYFIVRVIPHPYPNNPWEPVLFTAAVISYLLFAKTLFFGRDGYSWLNGIVHLGIYAVLLGLAIERFTQFLTEDIAEGWKYVKIMESTLRAFVGATGLYIVAQLYLKFPADRCFSTFFLAGNLLMLLGGIFTALFTIKPLFDQDSLAAVREWGVANRTAVMQGAVWLEILCFSLAIVKRQANPGQPSLPAMPDPVVETMPAAPQAEVKPAGNRRIAFRTSTGFEFVRKSDIICIQGGGNGANFIKVYREGHANPVIVSQTLAHTLRMLSGGDHSFRQLHKSYIINIRKICRLSKDEDGCMMAVMDNGMQVPVPADKVPALKSLLGLE